MVSHATNHWTAHRLGQYLSVTIEPDRDKRRLFRDELVAGTAGRARAVQGAHDAEPHVRTFDHELLHMREPERVGAVDAGFGDERPALRAREPLRVRDEPLLVPPDEPRDDGKEQDRAAEDDGREHGVEGAHGTRLSRIGPRHGIATSDHDGVSHLNEEIAESFRERVHGLVRARVVV